MSFVKKINSYLAWYRDPRLAEAAEAPSCCDHCEATDTPRWHLLGDTRLCNPCAVWKRRHTTPRPTAFVSRHEKKAREAREKNAARMRLARARQQTKEAISTRMQHARACRTMKTRRAQRHPRKMRHPNRAPVM